MSEQVPGDLKYTRDHEWVKVEAGLARVGITHFAQAQLGDIVYVELPKVGATLTAAKTLGVVESVKAASDIYSPLTGKVVEVNPRLADKPELVNSDPFGEGWMIVLEPASPAELAGLLDAGAYEKVMAEG